MLPANLISLLLLYFHPFHISVTSIYFAEEESSLQITAKIFADDLEEALNRVENTTYIDVLDPQNQTQLDSIVYNYLYQHLSFTINGTPVQPRFLGFEREELTMWCYLETSEINKLESVEVKNTLLLNTFDDQVNIVHIRANGVVKSMKLAHDTTVDTITF